MRLRSEAVGARQDHGRAPAEHHRDAKSGHSFAVLPAQAEAVCKLQAETGGSFRASAAELGYLRRGGIAGSSPLAVKGVDGLAGPGEVDPLVVMMSDQENPIVNAARELRSVVGSMVTRDGSPVKRVALLSLQARAETSVL